MDASVAAPRIKLKNRCKWSCFHNPMMILSALGPTTLRDSGSRPSGMRHRKTLINNKKNKKHTQKWKFRALLSLEVLTSESLSLLSLDFSLTLSSLCFLKRARQKFQRVGGCPGEKKKFYSDFLGGFCQILRPPSNFSAFVSKLQNNMADRLLDNHIF